MSSSLAKNRCVLLVDDDPFIIAVYVTKLKRAGLDVESVMDGAEAVRRLDAVKPDLVILDLNMPKLNGIEVLKHIRNSPALAALPVLVLTNVCSDSVMRETWDARPTRYLIKRETTPNAVVEEVVTLLKSAAPPAAAPEEGPPPAAPDAVAPPAAPAGGGGAPAGWDSLIAARLREVLAARTADSFRDALYRFRETAAPQIGHCRAQPEGSFAVLFAEAWDSLFEELYGHPESATPSLLRAFEMCCERLRTMFGPEPAASARFFGVAVVLIVAPEDVLRESLSRILGRGIFRPIRVGDVGAALHLIRENSFQLIVVETQERDEALDRIQALPSGARCPVIAVTDSELYRPSQKTGFERVMKPVNPADLYAKSLLLVEQAGI